MTRLYRNTIFHALVLLLCLFSPDSRADTAEDEIDYLLASVGRSACTFIRNGEQHSAKDAEAHLRMKYRRGKRYASSSEKFIERLASKSSLSKQPYYIKCGEDEQMAFGEWLTQRLREYRATQS
jgi:Family of unknown function (DUF5329)